MVESEFLLEHNFMKVLQNYQYDMVEVKNMEQLEQNLKTQLEILNEFEMSNEEFDEVKNFLLKGDNIKKAKKLRDGFPIKRDNKIAKTISFFDSKDWCRNNFQVTNQIKNEGIKKNRYDVTILINGFPLIHCELKRRGGNLEEGINQINRYQRHSMQGWFEYVQIFIVSCGTDTVYCANNKFLDSKFTFRWANSSNEKMFDLITEFTPTFLDKCNAAKMIAKYIIISETDEEKKMVIMRPYQVHAVECILNKVHEQIGNGYIWHTTGSGKTLTSYKVCELIAEQPHIDKVLFVVDRNDLDTQTVSEYQKFQNAHERDKIKPTENTNELMKKLKGGTDKIIITTIQKLDRAVTKYRNKSNEDVGNKRIVLIFDECHRSQKGNMHANIDAYFGNPQKFGFTGTPILEENKGDSFQTTETIFGERLHTYLIHKAIEDRNVLGFSIDNKNVIPMDEEFVNDINFSKLSGKAEEERCRKIVSDIIEIHFNKTYRQDYNAILAVKSVKSVIMYYDIFKELKEFYKDEHGTDLRVGAIFSSSKNEENDLGEEYSDAALERIINDFNDMFKDDKNSSNCSIDDVKVYNQQMSRRVKRNEIDILIVCSMFLTGFDAECLNTIYLDKDLKFHNMLQAISRTNRVTKRENKSYGQVVCYQPNNRENIDTALKLFADEDAIGFVLMEDYEHYKDEFNVCVKDVKTMFPNVRDVLNEPSETKKFEFAKMFRKLLEKRSILTTFREFSYDDLNMSEQDINDYISAYQKIKTDLKEIKEIKDDELVDEIGDFDWGISLISHDIVNYDYISRLIGEVAKTKNPTERENKITEILNDPKLVEYKELVKEFFDTNIEDIHLDDTIIEELFMRFIENYQDNKIMEFENEYGIIRGDLKEILDTQKFSLDKLTVRIRRLFSSYNIDGEIKKYTFGKSNTNAKEIDKKIEELNEYLSVFN